MFIKVVGRKEIKSIATEVMGVAAITTAISLSGRPVLAGYTKGEIAAKAKPIIDLLKDLSEPVTYGVFVWGMIRYILGQRAEAMQTIKSAVWGYAGVQILPWMMDILRSIGD